MKSLVWIEQKYGRIKQTGLQLLKKLSSIAGEAEITAVLLKKEGTYDNLGKKDQAAELFEKDLQQILYAGAGQILIMESEQEDGQLLTQQEADLLLQAIEIVKPELFLAASGFSGNDVCSYMAAQAGCGFLSDAVEVTVVSKDACHLQICRPSNTGKEMLRFTCRRHFLQLVTLKVEDKTLTTAAPEEPAVSDEPAASDEPAVSDEPAASDELAAPDEPAVPDETVALDEPAASDEPAAPDEPAVPDATEALDRHKIYPVQASFSPLAKTVSLLSSEKAQKEESDITKASCLVAGGRGAGGETGFEKLWDLAAALDAEVATSRPNVDEGWIEKERQVGLSGKSVSPELYLAFGISGSAHHVVGMEGSKKVFAVNIDQNAPIFDVADVGIVGDMNTIVPLLTEKVKKWKKKQ